jgi:hypothetical protein
VEKKSKDIHKNKHDHIQTYMENMFVIVGITRTRGRRERKRMARINNIDTFICAGRKYNMY